MTVTDPVRGSTARKVTSMPTPDLDLHDLARPALGVPIPSAAEIRRRGGVRRRNRLIASLSVIAAGAVLATGIAWGTGQFDALPTPLPSASATQESRPAWSEPPVGSSPSPGPQPTWSSFPTQKELGYPVFGGQQPEVDETGWTDQAKASACYVDGASLGARTVLSRNIGGGGEAAGETLVLLGFEDESAATAARKRIAEWYRSCGDRLQEKGNPMGRSEAGTVIKFDGKVPTGAAAEFHTVVWKTPKQEWGNFENASVVQVGNQLSWQFFPAFDAPDNNCVATGPDDVPMCEVAVQATVIARKLGG